MAQCRLYAYRKSLDLEPPEERSKCDREKGLFVAFAGSTEARPFRRPYVFGGMCIAFGMGAAIGAGMTEVTRAYSLAIPVTLLMIVFLLCQQNWTAVRK